MKKIAFNFAKIPSDMTLFTITTNENSLRATILENEKTLMN